jgi:hypothetical protein
MFGSSTINGFLKLLQITPVIIQFSNGGHNLMLEKDSNANEKAAIAGGIARCKTYSYISRSIWTTVICILTIVQKTFTLD